MAESDLNSDWRVWLTAYAPLIVWIAIIFYLSSSSGSMTATSRFIRPLLEFLFPASSEEVLLTFHFYIRKLGHISVYAILGFFAVRAFLQRSKVAPVKFAFAMASIVVLAVAVADEFNQSFNTSRTSSAGDVLLDCIGGLFAIVTYLAIRRSFANSVETSLRSNL